MLIESRSLVDLEVSSTILFGDVLKRLLCC